MSKNVSTHARFGRYLVINEDSIALSILLRHFMYMKHDE